ncbi:MAG: hypothetical protein ACI4SX_01170 [Candidatus Fimenecus sp.]
MDFSEITIHDPFIFCGSNYSVEVLKTGVVIKNDMSLSEIPYKNILALKYIPFLSPHIILRFSINGESNSYTISSGNFKFKRIKCLYKEIIFKKSIYDRQSENNSPIDEN